MTTKETAPQLTPSLEDYLETIWIRIGSAQLSLSRDQAELVKIVRVVAGQGGDDQP